MSLTRVRALVAIAALLAPVELTAQRLPLPGTGRRGPARPAPLPPQAEPVARHIAYKRLPLSVETYPLMSYIRSPGFTEAGVFSDWTAFGAGTRADYRLSPFVSLTLDLTSSFAGGPANVHTAEIGTRLRPERSERRLYPFVDARVGYIVASGGYGSAVGGEFGFPSGEGVGGFRYSHGLGGVGGAGVEYTLTRTLSLTTAGSVMRNRMTTLSLVGEDRGAHRYTMTVYRYTVGLRWNPVRAIRVPGLDHRQPR